MVDRAALLIARRMVALAAFDPEAAAQAIADTIDPPFRSPPPTRAKPAPEGQWKGRHYDRPDLFDQLGNWRPGVDRLA